MQFKLFNKERDTKLFKKLVIAIVVIACLLIIKDELVWQFDLEDGYYDDYSYSDEYSGDCNVAKIDLKAFMDIEAYDDETIGSSDIVWLIEDADYSENIKAIILEVDSVGGYPVAGEEINNALVRAEIPTVALIRGYGISAAYWASSGADVIFASALSDIGSIGVTQSYLDNVRQNQMEGLNYNELNTGKYKDTMSPDKTLTYSEKLLIQRDLDITLDYFIKAVSENRNLSIEKVKALADGSTMMGQMALENGLIDYIGGLYEVKQYLSDLIDEEAVICQ